MRTKQFAQPSVREIQTIRSMASVETKEDINQKKFTKTLFIHYTHENRLEPLKRDIHTIYSDVFHGTNASDIRLIIGHRNSRSIECELIQKRPHSSFVKLKPMGRKNQLLSSVNSHRQNIFLPFTLVDPNSDQRNTTN